MSLNDISPSMADKCLITQQRVHFMKNNKMLTFVYYSITEDINTIYLMGMMQFWPYMPTATIFICFTRHQIGRYICFSWYTFLCGNSAVKTHNSNCNENPVGSQSDNRILVWHQHFFELPVADTTPLAVYAIAEAMYAQCKNVYLLFMFL